MSNAIAIRRFQERDAGAVRALFLAVNEQLAPPTMKAAFRAYAERAVREEIGRISAYYGARGGAFFVAEADGAILGMFGLEPHADGGMELRRMYVAPAARRRGLARRMLAVAEDWCRDGGITALHLSTSELQREALAFYRNAGYRLVREETATDQSNKTIGGGIRRFHFRKDLTGAA